MHPLPLTGTETPETFSAALRGSDASPTPHGDGNLFIGDDNLSVDLDASPTPHGDGNLGTVTVIPHEAMMHPLPLTGTETCYVPSFTDASPTPHGDGNWV